MTNTTSNQGGARCGRCVFYVPVEYVIQREQRNPLALNRRAPQVLAWSKHEKRRGASERRIRVGQCMRFPPAIQLVPQASAVDPRKGAIVPSSFWPIVSGVNTWCGEYVQKEGAGDGETKPS